MCFLSRGSFRLFLNLPFYLLVLLGCFLFPNLVLILLAFVSHRASPFQVVLDPVRLKGQFLTFYHVIRLYVAKIRRQGCFARVLPMNWMFSRFF